MEGVVTILKPPGMSSSDAVVDVRRLYHTKRVGHLGTLDPMAAGVLPVCVGRAVRLFDYLVDKQKTYLGEIAFGVSTDTQDAQGAVLARSDAVVTAKQLSAVLPQFRGEQEQVAPMYSALKYQGQKLYDLAKRGVEVPEKRRIIRLDTLELVAQLGENRFLLQIGCSRGTYIRTLCADLGSALGVPAHMAFLLRTASGAFTLEQSYTIAELGELAKADALANTLVSCEDAISFLPPLTLAADRLTATKNGLPTHLRGVADGTYRFYCGTFLGVGTVCGGDAKLKVHLYEETPEAANGDA